MLPSAAAAQDVWATRANVPVIGGGAGAPCGEDLGMEGDGGLPWCGECLAGEILSDKCARSRYQINLERTNLIRWKEGCRWAG